MILVCALLTIGAAQADVPPGTHTLRGTLLSLDAGAQTLRVLEMDGAETVVMLARDVVIAIGEPLPRTSLNVGQLVTVNAADIELQGRRLLIAGLYLQADPSVAKDEKGKLTREFLPASGRNEGSDTSVHTIVSGRLVSVEATSLTIDTTDGELQVKLAPEAVGQRLRWGGMSDLRVGSTVTMAVPEGGVRAVLIAD